MKIRLGTLTGSPETGTGSSGMYWNDDQDLKSGVTKVVYADSRGKGRVIWPDSDILHIQSIKLDLTPEMARQIDNFDKQARTFRELVKIGGWHSMVLEVNGRKYDMKDMKNTRWDASTNSLLFLRNSGPTPGRIVRGDYATVTLYAPPSWLERENAQAPELETLIEHLAPIFTCDVEMTAGWADGVDKNASDEHRAHVLLCDQSNNPIKEVMGQYSTPSSGSKKGGGGGGSPKFWEGTETVRGVNYDGKIMVQGPSGKAKVKVSYPAYNAAFTVRIVEVIVS